jgi:hypothetical protein
VVLVQEELPNARVLYSSATGATVPHNLRYMIRLGHEGFHNMSDLITTLKGWVGGCSRLQASHATVTHNALYRRTISRM